MKLLEIKELKGKIIIKSGLHIGSGNMEMQIGGTDNPVIKHPHTLEPYIPGSSLKGKVRSLLEIKSGLMKYTKGDVLSPKILSRPDLEDDERKQAEAILKIFGSSGADTAENFSLGPTRVSFSDCYLDSEWKNKAIENRWVFTETKVENRIDRIRGTAESPRHTERVPAGAEFNFHITFKILEESDRELLHILLQGLKLLEMDTLGGNGSRGYGRIEFVFSDPEIQKSFHTLNPF